MVCLDITAGNRHMWTSKRGKRPPVDDECVVFLDVERELKVSPDIFADNRHLPIRDAVVDTIVYDPPHWNFGTSFHGDPKESEGSFWGNFKNGKNLRRLLAGGARESNRVLRPGGMLILKWCEARFTYEEVSVFFTWAFIQVGVDVWPSMSNRSKIRSMWVSLKRREVV